MSKWTVVGDPHAVNNNLEQIGTLFDILEGIGNPVIILGDLFDTKEIIRGKIFNYVCQRLSSSKLKFVILVGNHDWFNLDCADHSLKALKLFDNVTVVDQPLKMGKVGFLPYYEDLARFKKDAKALGVKRLFIHQGVVGFDYGNGLLADGSGHGEIEAEALSGFETVISGHFHKYATKGNLTFLGTPFSKDFGETDQVKYIGIFDDQTGVLELVKTPFPRHQTFDVRLGPNPNEDVVKVYNDKGNNIYRFRLIGTELQISQVDMANFPDAKFLEEPTDGDQVGNSNVKDTDSNEQKFLVWAKEIKGLDPETIAEGLEILKAC
jgi:hypothetical protein